MHSLGRRRSDCRLLFCCSAGSSSSTEAGRAAADRRTDSQADSGLGSGHSKCSQFREWDEMQFSQRQSKYPLPFSRSVALVSFFNSNSIKGKQRGS